MKALWVIWLMKEKNRKYPGLSSRLVRLLRSGGPGAFQKKTLGRPRFASWDGKTFDEAYVRLLEKEGRNRSRVSCVALFSGLLSKEAGLSPAITEKISLCVAFYSFSGLDLEKYCLLAPREQLDYRGLFFMMSSLTSYGVSQNLALSFLSPQKAFLFNRALTYEANRFIFHLAWAALKPEEMGAFSRADFEAQAENSFFCSALRAALVLNAAAGRVRGGEKLKALVKYAGICRELQKEMDFFLGRPAPGLCPERSKFYSFSFLPSGKLKSISGKTGASFAAVLRKNLPAQETLGLLSSVRNGYLSELEKLLSAEEVSFSREFFRETVGSAK